jgi:predicted nucleic acid-binding protein
MTALLDTAVLVDILRAHPAAKTWLSGQDQLGASPVVWLEIIEGAKDAKDQAVAVKLLQSLEKIEVLPADFNWAIRQALRFRLSHNVDMMDCLIAASAHRLGIPLFTHNLKHFQPMIGNLAQKPY